MVKTLAVLERKKIEIQSGSSEETTDNIHVLTPELKKHNDLKFEKQKEKPVA